MIVRYFVHALLGYLSRGSTSLITRKSQNSEITKAQSMVSVLVPVLASNWSRSVVGIGGRTIEGSEFEWREIQECSFFRVVQTSSGAHVAS
jgi:hypothetical protein